MDIKKRKVTAKRIRVREESDSASDSDSDSANVVRPGEEQQSKKRKRTDLNNGFSKRPESTKAELEKADETENNNTNNGEEKKDAKPETKVGPVKAASAIRMTTFTDFAPDVCKDVSNRVSNSSWIHANGS